VTDANHSEGSHGCAGLRETGDFNLVYGFSRWNCTENSKHGEIHLARPSVVVRHL